MPPKKSLSSQKRARKDRQTKFRAQRINIGDQIERWKSVKDAISANKDSSVAELLINNYLDIHAGPTVDQMVVTTPKVKLPVERQLRMSTPAKKDETLPSEPDISSINEAEGSDSTDGKGNDGPTLASWSLKKGNLLSKPGPSGVKRKSQIEATKPYKLTKTNKSSLDSQREMAKKATRVEFDISTTDMEDLYDPDYDPDDPTYQPEEWNISIVQSDDEDLEEYGMEDDVFDIEHEDEEDVAEQAIANFPPGPGIPRIITVTADTMSEEKYLISRGRLDALLEMAPMKSCSRCHKATQRCITKTGSVVICKWACEDGHTTYRWASSSMMPNGTYTNNFQAMSSVVVSGNNYTKVALFARFLRLSFPSRASFNRLQTKCVVPVVERYWTNLKKSGLEEHRAGRVVVSGDGRMDSPGHCAKYCTYTVMNQSDKAILAMEVVDKRETGLKSVLMEAKGFSKAMESIRDEGVQLEEIVTDAHPQISSIMKKSYPQVRHSYDMWHGAKNLGKKISKIAIVKGNEQLKPWLKDITNHFFYCAENCDGNVLEMKTKWLSIMNHITDRHSWALGECDHDPIETERDDEKQWLKRGSQVLKDLEKQVIEKRLLRTFPYYLTCQTTSELEMFNNHILMYAPKRNAFSYSVYKCRCQLAAIDYTKHLNRKQMTDKDGNPRSRRMYSKAASNWSVVPVKEPKTYIYVHELLSQIGREYCRGEVTLRSKVQLDLDHPKRIARTIAPKSPPPTAELQTRQMCRLKGKDPLRK